jgi:hypothetical protein
MDVTKFVEIAEKYQLLFIYSGERMQEEQKCQKVIKKTHAEGNVAAVVFCNMMFSEGLVLTDKGIWFATGSGNTGLLSIRKAKGSFPFNKFLLHNVSVKKSMLKDLKVEFILWNIEKEKSTDFRFEILVDGADNSTCEELAEAFMVLASKTGTEYEEKDKEEVVKTDSSSTLTIVKDPNSFEFLWGNLFTNIHTIIKLNDGNIIVSKFKFDDKTKIQTSIGGPATISRSAVSKIKKGRGFSPLTVLGAIGIGIVIGFLGIGGVYTVALFTLLGLLLAFPRLLIIKRKDGTKFKIRLSGSDINIENYERLMSVIFN